MKRTENLAPVLQIVQKIPENYWPCLYLSVNQVWLVNELCFKRYSKMHPVSCTNSSWHHRLGQSGNDKNTKVWISWEQIDDTFCVNIFLKGRQSLISLKKKKNNKMKNKGKYCFQLNCLLHPGKSTCFYRMSFVFTISVC